MTRTTVREEYTANLVETFVVQHLVWGDPGYTDDKWVDEDAWVGPNDAYEWIIEQPKSFTHRFGYRIVRRVYNSTNHHRILFNDEVIFAGGEWLFEKYDPRMKDPRFQQYLALKKEFESD